MIGSVHMFSANAKTISIPLNVYLVFNMFIREKIFQFISKRKCTLGYNDCCYVCYPVEINVLLQIFLT